MRNEHKKATHEDKFARHYYCERARLGYIRNAKKANSKKFRKIGKNICKNLDNDSE